jgi:hypothetical protein
VEQTMSRKLQFLRRRIDDTRKGTNGRVTSVT